MVQDQATLYRLGRRQAPVCGLTGALCACSSRAGTRGQASGPGQLSGEASLQEWASRVHSISFLLIHTNVHFPVKEELRNLEALQGLIPACWHPDRRHLGALIAAEARNFGKR